MAVIPRAIEALSGEMNTLESADVRSIANDSILHRKGRIGKSELVVPSSSLFPVSCLLSPVPCFLLSSLPLLTRAVLRRSGRGGWRSGLGMCPRRD